MPLDAELEKKMLQLVTSRYDDRHRRKKIEKTLSLSQSGVTEPTQQQIFMYLKIALKAYKSRRADPDTWIIGGYATKEVIDRAKFQPHLVGSSLKSEDVAFLGTDPGEDVTEAWWEEMLDQWFDVPEEEKPAEEEGGEAADSDASLDDQVESLTTYLPYALCQAATDRLTRTSTFKPACVNMVMRVSTLKSSILPRMRSLIRGWVTPRRSAALFWGQVLLLNVS